MLPFILRQNDCWKFQRQTWKPLVDVLLVTLLCLELTASRPELLHPSKLSKQSEKCISSTKLSDWFVCTNCYLFYIHVCVCVCVCVVSASASTWVCVNGQVGRCRVSVSVFSGLDHRVWYSGHSGKNWMVVCVCVYVCVCVCWGQGWGLGGMELWVGSNIMTFVLLQLLIWHLYFIFFVYTYT